MNRIDYIKEINQKFMNALPDAIKALQEIINDDNTSDTIRIKASNSLSRAQRSFEQVRKSVKE